MEYELDPCPFCGSSNCHTKRHYNRYDEVWWGVKCYDCGAEKVSKQYDLPTDAMDGWNRRNPNGKEKVACDICTDKGHCPEYVSGAACVNERKPVDNLVNVVIGRRAKWISSKKHIWQRDENGEIDLWAQANDFHNGPVCRVCWESPCVHCRPDWQSIPCIEKHSECSACGEPQIEESNYCPSCGATMDGGN